ncbi:MAG: cryptochrome/photolyase family protein [Cyanobacteria bacterium P01_H01_bin.74]
MPKTLVFLLGDQLNLSIAALNQLNKSNTIVLMAEVRQESTKVPSHKVRTVMFLSAMRHFKEILTANGYAVDYIALDTPDNTHTLHTELKRALDRHKPEKVVITEPGEWQIQQDLIAVLEASKVAYECRDDDLFLSSVKDFKAHAKGRKQLRMEFFYREMRKRYDILMENGKPLQDQWNFDAKNRGSFGKKGPGLLPIAPQFPPDEITQAVIQTVDAHFPENPGQLSYFDWPVTTEQATVLLDFFVAYLLPQFGQYQDAMWTGQPYLYHSKLSAALNLKLLNPLTVIKKAEQAYYDGQAPIEAVEGFIRQILGWREYIRGMYWLFMPAYTTMNFFDADEPLPELFWTGKTTMYCLKETVQQTLDYGYAHHIQRLMVTGLFSLMLGVKPGEIHAWYLAVYLDAVEWAELPNVLGMSQFVDGGKLASKPYVATGKYIQRMSNYCNACHYDPAESTGDKACPFTTFYWDFLDRHQSKLKANQRMGLQLRNLTRLTDQQREAIQAKAKAYRNALRAGGL